MEFELERIKIADVKEFDTRIKNIFRRRGYEYLDQLKGFDYASIQRITGIGKKAANTIMTVLMDTYYPAILWE